MRRWCPLIVLSLLEVLCGVLPAPVRSQAPVRTRELSPAEQTSAERFGRGLAGNDGSGLTP